jgi:hypothetical protein
MGMTEEILDEPLDNGIELSLRKWQALEPEVFGVGLRRWSARRAEELQFWTERLSDQLAHGNVEAAVVVHTKPLIVAAYSSVMDTVALLRFPDFVAETESVSYGSRLLSVNYYSEDAKGSDLKPGMMADDESYTDFAPLIADFLCDDSRAVAQAKQMIADWQWTRAEEQGRHVMAESEGKTRDGRPTWSWKSA